MKICLLTPRFPYPQFGGDTLRINEIARYLKSQGHHLVLVSLSDDSEPDISKAKSFYDSVYFVKRNRFCSLVYTALYFLLRRPLQCGYYRSRSFARLFDQVREIEKPDIYISHLLRMAPYLEERGLQQESIVEMTDALSKTYGLSSGARGVGLLKYIYQAERRLIRKYEQKVIASFRKVVLVSQQDVDFLRNNGCEADTMSVFTNGVDCMQEILSSFDSNKICFIGNMRSMQNQDAVIFFAREVFPLIKQKRPNSKFYVVGSLPPDNIQCLASDDIIITGFVDDLEAMISDSCVAVAPVRVAAGIQNKVLVAMGCGIPVVLTSLIAKSIPELQHNENCLLADTAQTIADCCISVMSDTTIRTRLGQSGYKMVSSHYSWHEKLSGYEMM